MHSVNFSHRELSSTQVVIAVCVAVAHAGFSGGSSGGWQQQQSSGWEQQQSSGWQQQPQQEQKILIIKQQGGHGGSTGGSLTVAGPTHVIKTIHQVRTIDQGGKILSKSGGGGSAQQAKVLVVKEIKTAQIQHAPQQQNNGWPQQQQSNGWASQQQNNGW